VAAALVEAVRPLAQEAVPVELSLTGGKDSRLIAAALAAADVPFRARTHGSARHPDVVIAGLIAERLGVEHTVTEPRAAAGTQDRADVLSRVRSAVLVSDGMLSAFENVGGADGPVQIGGHVIRAAPRRPAPAADERAAAPGRARRPAPGSARAAAGGATRGTGRTGGAAMRRPGCCANTS
jgi:hypothetical protein